MRVRVASGLDSLAVRRETAYARQASLRRTERDQPLNFKEGNEVRFWLHGDPLSVRLSDGIWRLGWQGQKVEYDRLDHALASLLGRSRVSVVPLMIRLLREPPETEIE